MNNQRHAACSGQDRDFKSTCACGFSYMFLGATGSTTGQQLVYLHSHFLTATFERHVARHRIMPKQI